MEDKQIQTSEGKRSFIQLIKFGLVGVSNTLVDFVVYTLLVLIFGIENGDTFLIGLFTFIAYGCGVLNSFILNTRWTFKKEYKKTGAEAVKFVAVNLISWGLSFFLVWLFSNHVFADSIITNKVCELLGMEGAEQIQKMGSILSKILSVPIVIMVNFLGNKLFVFNKK